MDKVLSKVEKSNFFLSPDIKSPFKSLCFSCFHSIRTYQIVPYEYMSCFKIVETFWWSLCFQISNKTTSKLNFDQDLWICWSFTKWLDMEKKLLKDQKDWWWDEEDIQTWWCMQFYRSFGTNSFKMLSFLNFLASFGYSDGSIANTGILINNKRYNNVIIKNFFLFS